MHAAEREERGEEAVGDEGPADRLVLAVTATEPKSIRFILNSVLHDVHATHAHLKVNSAPFSDKGGFRATRKQPGYAPD